MIRFCIILLSVLFSQISNAQIDFKPILDTKSNEVKSLFIQKKYTKALSLVNQSIKNDPTNGLNYFTKAVLNYYNLYGYGFADTAIINDCKRALSYGYKNPEVNYLIFSQYCDCDKVINYGNPMINGEEIDFNKAKEQINLAINQDRINEKYLIARIEFYKKNMIVEMEMNETDFSTFKIDCENLVFRTSNNIQKSKGLDLLFQIFLYHYEDTLKALSYLTDAIQVNPNNVDLYDSRAALKYAMENYQGAISDYNIYLSKRKNAEQYKERGRCFLLLNKSTLAIKDFNIALVLYEKERTKLLNQKENLRVGKQKFDLAETFNLRGLAYVTEKNEIKACQDFNKAVDLGSKDALVKIKEYCGIK